MPSRIRLILPAFAIGLVGTTAQVIIIRELLVALTGNELTIAVSLAAWLSAAAGGSAIYRKLGRAGEGSTAGLLIIAGLLLPFQVISVRLLHPLVSSFGEILGPGMILALSALGVLPGAMVLGALFVAIVADAGDRTSGRPIALVYGIEALGSGVAGLLLSTYLLESLNPLAVIGLAALVGLAGGWYLHLSKGDRPRGAFSVLAAVSLAGLAVAVATSGRMDLASRALQWRPLRVAETSDSRYGNLVVTSRDSTYDFFESGTLAFTIPDAPYAEECAHIPLLHHPQPRQILVLGGAGSGVIREILKHGSVRTIDYIEIDPASMAVMERFSPPGSLDGNGRASVNALYGDAREYVAKTSSMYDVVIVNVGTPTTLQLNRYYTVEFFRSAEKILNRNGILSLKIASPGAYVGPELGRLVASVTSACKAALPNVIVLPGEYIHILASPGLDLRSQTPLVLERLRRRAIEASYVNGFVLWDRFSQLRIAQLDSAVAAYDDGRPNSDMKPVTFRLAISIWEKHTRVGRAVSDLTSWLKPERCLLLMLAACVITVMAFALVSRSRLNVVADLAILYAMGLTTMFTLLLAVLGLQIVSGYLYGRIAALIAAFMGGMGTTSMMAGLKSSRPGIRRPTPALIAGLAVPPIAVILAASLLGRNPRAVPSQAADITFAAVAFATGALGGSIFASASTSLVRAGKSDVAAASLAYSLDLAGAATAGLATGFLMIPAIGIAESAYVVSIFSLVVLAGVVILRKVSSGPLPH